MVEETNKVDVGGGDVVPLGHETQMEREVDRASTKLSTSMKGDNILESYLLYVHPLVILLFVFSVMSSH